MKNGQPLAGKPESKPSLTPLPIRPETKPLPKPELPPIKPAMAVKIEKPVPLLPKPLKVKKAPFWSRWFTKEKKIKPIVPVLPGEKRPLPPAMAAAANLKKETGKGKSKDKPKKEKISFLDVNLIPEELSRHPEMEFSKKLFITLAVVFGAGLLIACSYLGLTWYQIVLTRQVQDIKDDIAVLDTQIQQYKDDEAAAKDLQSSLGQIKQLLNSHIYWTKFFSLLEKNTISEVYFTNFSMVGQTEVNLAAVGKDYYSVAKQLLAFRQAKDFVKNVRIDSASALIEKDSNSYAGVTFNVKIEFQPDVFLKPIK
jgi:hypothetical protein